MSNKNNNKKLNRSVRVAGILFLLNLMVPLLNWTFILSKLQVSDNIMDTAKNIIANELLFRIGISIELLMSLGLIILAVALYNILKSVNKNLALVALCIKLIEASLMAVTVLVPFIALQLSALETSQTVFSSEQLMYPIGIIFNSHTAITSIPMFFLGVDMMIFSYLFLKSKYIPRTISVFGIISFALVFIHACMFIITPEYATMPINQLIFWTPSGIFEIVIGIWLLTRGLRLNKIKND